MEIITWATEYIVFFLTDSLSRSLETIRIARAASALSLAGSLGSGSLSQQAIDFLLMKQRSDGGWSDPEETAWAVKTIIFAHGSSNPRVQTAIKWLQSACLPTGGWGRHPRDQARIPITALISSLVPAAFKSEDLNWLQNEWARDFSGPVMLSYKAGFFLLAMAQRQENDLVVRTISHLAQDQNDDGGFGPWKGHPIGSDPWSTGVVLWGLSKWIDHIDAIVIEKALAWLRNTQLPSGYWPYHYLDDGTSLALIGAVAAMKALAANE
jgi:squalene cyclase